jgi:hypothetical protein
MPSMKFGGEFELFLGIFPFIMKMKLLLQKISSIKVTMLREFESVL